MKPFIIIPAGIQNSKGNNKEVAMRIQPDEIDYYYEGFYNGTVVVNKSGNILFTPLSVNEIDSLLVSYSTKQLNKFGILSLKIEK